MFFRNISFFFRMALETDLKIEREWRVGLQKNLEEEQLKSVKLQAEVVQLSEVKKVQIELCSQVAIYILCN
jgi:hypothetical protein